MKISISGAQSTGKTTLIDKLKEDSFMSSNFIFKCEVLRDIKKEGFNINENGDDNTQYKVLSKMIDYYTLNNLIADRSFLDCMVYTAYLFTKGKVKKETLSLLESAFEYLRYDLYFYIAPEFDIVKDGTRSEDNEFRKDIVNLFEEYIEAYSLPVIRLTGSVEERAKQITEIVKQIKENESK